MGFKISVPGNSSTDGFDNFKKIVRGLGDVRCVFYRYIPVVSEPGAWSIAAFVVGAKHLVHILVPEVFVAEADILAEYPNAVTVSTAFDVELVPTDGAPAV